MFHYTHHCCYCITRPSINVTSVVYLLLPIITTIRTSSCCLYQTILSVYCAYIVYGQHPNYLLLTIISFHIISLYHHRLAVIIITVIICSQRPPVTQNDSLLLFPARKNRHLHIGTRAISLTPFTYSVLRQQAVPPPINIYLASAAAAPFSIASCDLIRAMSDPTTWDFFHGISSMLWVIWGCYSASLLN